MTAEMKIYKCPLCHAVSYVYIGEPPARYTYRNKCGYKALNGKPNRGTSHNYKFSDSWRGVGRGGSKGRCEFPYTDRDGIPLDCIPLREYIDFTRAPYSVRELAEKIVKHNQSLGRNVDVALIKSR